MRALDPSAIVHAQLCSYNGGHTEQFAVDGGD
jgi:hypothetical protein